jgi:hypothetical protein
LFPIEGSLRIFWRVMSAPASVLRFPAELRRVLSQRYANRMKVL